MSNQPLIGEHSAKCAGRALTVKGITSFGIELRHQADQQVQMSISCAVLIAAIRK